ncbi:hypothetical protein [Pseudoalteromonas ruthenica]|uniref:hypothetical protein n=1 Tax=Pseudoalteromonas ruthenica TaxID=151081 RepID=UPI00110A5C0E|nr:hypothetical protein [Pseudoalteromonas ruthenica]TMO88061.1 hypothetical protein CWC12_07625 [Pseudoalteromonas ruthenica]TMP22693.1 hypothetical protein CWC06_13895 [Pseudoalteromonas ruthenica]
MKKAVIVVGSHFAGKSKTINVHVKKKLKIKPQAHKFNLKGKDGYILSQSFEEAERDVSYVIKKYGHYDLLVLAARPAHETPSDLNKAIKQLTAKGFKVYTVPVNAEQKESYYSSKADDVIKKLS